ncbi:hypothetical protein ACEWY4_003785 [Coilia grayii]|uniref:Transmembrane channel-like protein n=1 Tax=Coilia grayii TaxID=363190 RepID=A0ABD1KS80_9TELE
MQRGHMSTLGGVQLWRGQLKRVGAHFGTGVLSYFLFMQRLLLYNGVMAILMGMFVVLPQATLGPRSAESQQNFTGLELLTGEGYFTNSLLYYGFYTNSTPRQACLTPLLTECNEGVELGYSIPLAYLFIVIISFFITCILLVYSLSKSLGKTLQSEGGLTVWLFSSWDFKVTKKSSVFLRRANINTQLKELISERMAQRRRGWRVWLWQGLVCGLVWTICLTCTGVCILGIFLYVKFIHETVKHLFGLPLLVSCANLLLPGLFRAVSSAEGFQSPSTQAYVAITRNLLLKTSILSLLTYHWMTDLGTLSDTCWETYAGQELYRHVITDLLMTLLHTIFGEFLWSNRPSQCSRKPTPVHSGPRTYPKSLHYCGFFSCWGLVAKLQPGPEKKKAGPGISLRDHWDWGCEQTFNILKQMLIGAPVLGYADFSKPFVFEIDASGLGLGAVLSQEQQGELRRPIAYASRGLKLPERNMSNYSVMKLELLALGQ